MTEQSLRAETDPEAAFVFILGMHRSGTSCLAGGLEQCGLVLGDVARRSRKHNAKGSRELPAAGRLHRQILAASDGFWRHPPSRITAHPRQKQALRELAIQLAQDAPCGLKDPRLLLLMDVWLDIIESVDVSPVLVGTFRHPVAVARSLAKRNGMSEHEAYTLWLRYNAELVRLHQLYHLPLIEFDLSEVEAYCSMVADLAGTLGLKPDMARLQEFIGAELDHSRSLESPVPAMCQEIYAYLQRHRYQPGAYSQSDLVLQVRNGQQRVTQPSGILQRAARTLEVERQRYDGWRRLRDTLRWRMHLLARSIRHMVGRRNW